MKFSAIFVFLLIVIFAVSYGKADECNTGDVEQRDCNTCRCLKGSWACTKAQCLKKRAIPARFRRDMYVQEDLKDTPCAPNDYFPVDCNVCYCNLDHTGYLCTNNYCNGFEPATTVRIPMENDSMLILSADGVRFVEKASSANNDLSRIARKMDLNGNETSTDGEDGWLNQTVAVEEVEGGNVSAGPEEFNE
ncbi:hypothetical protein NQ315_001839 [Exocentrus adspersus]|uniref:Pacifastin domain-containing protein n=1 Tax=Exocentrus adspersus TaxID=1586481 RepID=A0AAV8W9L1_9CUCU|nr:hypothetical protein NQ315_001839 [Exocentrus adspersus]